MSKTKEQLGVSLKALIDADWEDSQKCMILIVSVLIQLETMVNELARQMVGLYTKRPEGEL